MKPATTTPARPRRLDVSSQPRPSEHWLLAAIVLLGLALRLHGLSDQALCHYDEGVYVSSGIRVAAAGWYEFAFGQPIHAPPLYPWVLSLVYRILQFPWPNVGLYVSALFGAATIPLVYGFARGSFGAATALVAALLIATSDVHIAFSRMALTDAALACWFTAAMGALALVADSEAVSRRWPGWAARVALAALCVGAAWNTKYNGWMPVLIALGAGAVELALARFRGARAAGVARAARLLAGGGAAGVLAGLLFLPWFFYVQREFPGGYAAVTAHHRSYMGGIDGWPASAWRLACSLPAFRHWGYVVVVNAAMFALLWPRRARTRLRWGLAVMIGLLVCVGQDAVWLALAVGALPSALLRGSGRERLAAVWLLAFLVLTPLYHPYVRLLLPALPAAAILAAPVLQSLCGRGHAEGEIEPTAGPTLMQPCFTAILLCGALALFGGQFGVLPYRALWQRWQSVAGYRAFAEAVLDETPSDAAVLCQGQPPFSVYCPRQALVLGNEPFSAALEGIPDQRPAYLALDFRVIHEPDPTALRDIRQHADCLTAVRAVTYDANIVTLLDYLTPAQVAAKLARDQAATGQRHEAAAAANALPPALEDNQADTIRLYRIDLRCVRQAAK